MKLHLLAGAALAALAVAGSAAAEQSSGWYGGVDLGYNQKGEYGARSTGNMVDGAPFAYDISTENNWAGFARLGYRYSPNWRLEFEGGIRPGEVDTAHGFRRDYGPTRGGFHDTALCTPDADISAACGGPSGKFDQTTLFANLIYDILPESTFHPFVGVGFGLDQIKAGFIGQYSVNPAATAEHLSFVDTDTVPATQLLAGMAWELSDSLSLDVTYKYIAVGKTEFSTISSTSAAGFVPGDFEGDFDNQTLSVGLRWAFGAAPMPAPPPEPEPTPDPTPLPPPPPPPPPSNNEAAPTKVAKEFIVYFGWDKYDLTAEAQSVVAAAADYAKSGGAARVVVVGHADTSGSAAYNIKLSERRAKTVADALAAAGVNPATLAVDWKGEAQPAVATGDGVKEPLNRRSTIDITF